MKTYTEMEMPTPCNGCGEWFDLHDGTGHGNIVYCEDCGTLLNDIDETKDRIEYVDIERENAVKGEKQQWLDEVRKEKKELKILVYKLAIAKYEPLQKQQTIKP